MSMIALKRYLTTKPHYLRMLLAGKLHQHLRQRWIQRNAYSSGDIPPPIVYKILLTERCNLSCAMCMNIPDHAGPASHHGCGWTSCPTETSSPVSSIPM